MSTPLDHPGLFTASAETAQPAALLAALRSALEDATAAQPSAEELQRAKQARALWRATVRAQATCHGRCAAAPLCRPALALTPCPPALLLHTAGDAEPVCVQLCVPPRPAVAGHRVRPAGHPARLFVQVRERRRGGAGRGGVVEEAGAAVSEVVALAGWRVASQPASLRATSFLLHPGHRVTGTETGWSGCSRATCWTQRSDACTRAHRPWWWQATPRRYGQSWRRWGCRCRTCRSAEAALRLPRHFCHTWRPLCKNTSALNEQRRGVQACSARCRVRAFRYWALSPPPLPAPPAHRAPHALSSPRSFLSVLPISQHPRKKPGQACCCWQRSVAAVTRQQQPAAAARKGFATRHPPAQLQPLSHSAGLYSCV